MRRAMKLDRAKQSRLTLADVAAKAGLIDPDQRWWWTEEWQEGEREVERDIKAGRGQVFDTPGEFLKSLKAL